MPNSPSCVGPAIAWLLERQQPTGAWHSTTYGALKQGAAVTALAAWSLALAQAQLTPDQRARLLLALAYLRHGTSPQGCVANLDGTLDYPEYATALAVLAARALGELSIPELKTWQRFLLAAQLQPENGFPESHIHHGGWDLLGGSRDAGLTTGANVSLTSFALEALQGTTNAEAQAARQRALAFLARCQNSSPGGDGGFFFTPARSSDGNKAQWHDREQSQPRSYGSATADGLRCLLACGLKADDPRCQAAIQWLAQHAGVPQVPGFSEAPPELGWAEGLSYYYLASLAGCLSYLPEETAARLRERTVAFLIAQQREAGCWQNASARMREDDPLIATGLALASLERMRKLA